VKGPGACCSATAPDEPPRLLPIVTRHALVRCLEGDDCSGRGQHAPAARSLTRSPGRANQVEQRVLQRFRTPAWQLGVQCAQSVIWQAPLAKLAALLGHLGHCPM